ncbi:CARDB domain-containing protein [Alkalicoccobacillus gibsonii]|uniref:CARDB domain-containing protein n=1 Tax=Alkalicoccobacillus gibsonii TaxID=79881 RepID=A0ABU9VNS6_9BACI
MFKKVSLLSCALIILLTTFAEFFPAKVEASVQSKKVEVYQGTSNVEMDHQNPKIMSFPQSSIGNYPSTLNYDEGGFTGTLQAKRIRLVPKNRIDKSYPVYKTETKTFTETRSGTYNDKGNGNFPNSVSINKEGYSGNISRTGISWTDNWVRNRSTTVNQTWTGSSYHEFEKDAGIPNRYTGTYRDNETGRNVSYSLAKNGGSRIVQSRNRTIMYRSEGRAQNYDKVDNYYLGYMSDNSTTYYAGRFSDPKPNDAPNQYYGIPRDLTNLDWKMVNYGWDESRAQNADDWKAVTVYSNGSYWWRSLSGRLNKWRKGAWIDYELKIREHRYSQNYRGSVSLPDYIRNHSGVATYSGRLSKQVLDYVQPKFVSNNWDVYVEYEGDIRETNLTAVSINVFDADGRQNPSILYEKRKYKIELTYRNTGSTNVGSHSVGIFLGNSQIQTKSQSSLNMGQSRTVTFDYVAPKTGTYKLEGRVDTGNQIKESTKADNNVSRNIRVEEVNLTARSIDVYDQQGNKNPTILYENRKYNVEVKYENTGTVSVSSHNVGLYLDNSRIRSAAQGSLNAGQTRTVKYEYSPNKTGTFSLEARVDDDNFIEESNENDNSVKRNIRVERMNLTARAIDIIDENGNKNPQILYKNRPYKVQVTYENTGTVSAPAHWVGIYLDSSSVKQESSLGVGQKRVSEFNFTPRQNGRFTMEGRVDIYNQIEESDETDNSVYRDIRVEEINLTAYEIHVFDQEGKRNPEMLYKGEKYQVEVEYYNSGTVSVGEHHVGLYFDNQHINTKKQNSINSGQYRTVKFDFTPNKNGKFILSGRIDNRNEVYESNEDDNEVSKDISIKEVPDLEISYSPNPVYEGDKVKVDVKPLDPTSNNLTVKLDLKKGNGSWSNLFNRNKIKHQSIQTHNEAPVSVQKYEYRATVTDEFGKSASKTISFTPIELKIIGSVNHTDRWKEIHEQLGNPSDQFYSGENFILSSEMTNHKPVKVDVELVATQVNKETKKAKRSLNHDKGGSFKGELYEDSFSQQNTKIQGKARFTFTGHWENGIVKSHVVEVNMVEDVYGVFDLYRSN